MLLQIVGVDQQVQFNVIWVELQTAVGNLIIQAEHAPTVLELQANSQIRFCLDSSKQKTLAVPAGFAHVTRQSVIILIMQNL